MADVFVSYASTDRSRIEPLVERIQAAGHSVWWDKNLQGGSRFSQEIESELRSASVALVVWTPSSVTSHWVVDEAEVARGLNTLLPVVLGGVDPPMGFRQIQTIDLAGWNGELEDPTLLPLVEAIRQFGQTGNRAAEATVISDSSVPDASIAVLPFVNMSSDSEQEYFADGLSEELLNLLAKIKEMRVTARTSSFEFKGQNTNISKIGELLGVAHVLEGSVRKAGNRVRITAQLVKTATGFHLWSDTYDRTLDDIFAIQDEISAAIVAVLKETILGDVEAPTRSQKVDPAAYELFLQGRQLLNERTRQSLEQGQKCFERALALEPEYAAAMIGLADVGILLSNSAGCYGDTPVEQAAPLATELVERALTLTPESDYAYIVLSLIAGAKGDTKGFRAHAEKAIELNPNASRAYRNLCQALYAGGDPDAPTMSTRRKALELDPMSLIDIKNMLVEYSSRGRFDEANALIEKMALIDSEASLLPDARISLAYEQGRLADILEEFYNWPQPFLTSGDRYNVVLALAVMGYGPAVEDISPIEALEIYGCLGLDDDLERLGNSIDPALIDANDYFHALCTAWWHCRADRYAETLAILSQFDEPDPERWGRHFDIDFACEGAQLTYLAHAALGNDDEASFYARKLEKMYDILRCDPDGIRFVAHQLGAQVALRKGNRELALDEIEQFVAKDPVFGIQVCVDPLLKALSDEPRYQAALKKVKDRIAAEKQTATDAGLLPLTPEFVARFKA